MGYLNHATATDGGSISATVTNDKPAGVADGDLMIWAIHADFSGGGTHFTWPGGWTPITTSPHSDSTVDDAQVALAYKVASGEGTNYSCTLFQSDWWVSVIVAYDNCPASPYDTFAGSSTDITADAGPSWTIDAVSLTTATDNEIVLWFGAIDNATTDLGVSGPITYVSPSGFTDRGSVVNTNWCSMAWADKVYATAGSTGSLTGSASVPSDTGNAGQIAVLVAFKQNASVVNLMGQCCL